MFEVGAEPYECATIEALNRELDAIAMSIPPDVALSLSDEQRRHLAGDLGELREVVEQRRRMVRQAVFTLYLIRDVSPVIARPSLHRASPRSD